MQAHGTWPATEQHRKKVSTKHKQNLSNQAEEGQNTRNIVLLFLNFIFDFGCQH